MKKIHYIIIILFIILLLIDQVTKIVFTNSNIQVIPNVLKFTYTENTGGAYGIGSGNVLMFILTNLVVLGIIIKFMINQKDNLDNITFLVLTTILAGGVGNIIDRIFRGYVVDFIDITEIINFPKFNLADIYIVCGWIVLAFIFAKNTVKIRKEL